ncbi:MAG: peptide chain release factor N(5)-glutamine methyltransferase [Desulfobulbaceae bacterium]|nr:peptide chain release factor N(5)-glutamine methyltransferase [Desulfobulbaceae bacterium]
MSITYKTLLEQADNHFQNRADAEFFMQALTNKKRHELFMDNLAIPKHIFNEFNKYLSRCRPDMPVQYLVNKAYFLSYELYIDERAMIPRPETEELVMKIADRLNKSSVSPNAILDIGMGSGAIAIALANMFPDSNVFATDISSKAIDVAKLNANKYGLVRKINLIQADLFPATDIKFGLIISNPPYIPHNEIKTLPLSVRNYEPSLALDGGKQGFEIIEKIIRQAPDYLMPKGLLALEIDPRQEKLIKNLVSHAQFEKDNQGFIRYAFIKYE